MMGRIQSSPAMLGGGVPHTHHLMLLFIWSASLKLELMRQPTPLVVSLLFGSSTVRSAMTPLGATMGCAGIVYGGAK